ncbi:putative RING finger protein ETP1 like protein [Glarea lozoyensis 74030]|uniref:Putative RING finger protein ETP1 like protein n=1 Tax=Glarea lozoyensis (strain ATCC 74030 / MF5533) TaxID=1104152 RepID=H0EIM1_GLAL7|nr:putative RING finger protein ETP1 like protein [Glarea lozoyensis 74030]
MEPETCSGCPVCRHTNRLLPSPTDPPFGTITHLCTICDTPNDLWICLICGNVGCGRYAGGHAKEHWKDSAHNFSLEIETQHVWDYAGDCWVHRLIRGKGDDKIMELPSSSRVEGEGEGDLVPREKLEGIGMEYTHLLTSQLESQRIYYESLLSQAVSKSAAASTAVATASEYLASTQAQLDALKAEHETLKSDTLPNLEKELAREKRKAEKSAEMARAFGKQLKEERKVSEGLMERIGWLEERMGEIKREVGVVRGELEQEREVNRDLMFALGAGEKLKEMGEEVEGGSVMVPLPPPSEGKGDGRKGGKGKGRK